MNDYDSTADTLAHSRRVGQLIGEVVTELVGRMTGHDLSKTQPPEKAIFDEFTPRLKTTTYGTPQYKEQLEAMGEALRHHYDSNRHHPEHFSDGVAGMNLVDLVEMLADWKAATERHDDGQIDASLPIQRQRFGITAQLQRILRNTVVDMDWSDLPGDELPATDADLAALADSIETTGEAAQGELAEVTRQRDSLARRLAVRFAETEVLRGALFTADQILRQVHEGPTGTPEDAEQWLRWRQRVQAAAVSWRSQHAPKLATTETLEVTVEDDDDPDGTPVEGAFWEKEGTP